MGGEFLSGVFVNDTIFIAGEFNSHVDLSSHVRATEFIGVMAS